MEVDEEEVGFDLVPAEPEHAAIAVLLEVVDGVGADEPGFGWLDDVGHFAAAEGDEGGAIFTVEGVVVECVAGADEVVHRVGAFEAGDGYAGVFGAFVEGRAEGFEFEGFVGGVGGDGLGDDVAVEGSAFGADFVDAVEREASFFAAEEGADDGIATFREGAFGLWEVVVEVVEVELDADPELLEAAAADGGFA